MSQLFRRLRIDPYICAILGMVVIATILPARGQGADFFGHATKGLSRSCSFCTVRGSHPERRSMASRTGVSTA